MGRQPNNGTVTRLRVRRFAKRKLGHVRGPKAEAAKEKGRSEAEVRVEAGCRAGNFRSFVSFHLAVRSAGTIPSALARHRRNAGEDPLRYRNDGSDEVLSKVHETQEKYMSFISAY